MTKLIKYLEDGVQPASIRVASLTEKRTERSCGFQADYVGFSIPDKFIVGHGIDYNEAYREMGHIGIVNAVNISILIL